MKNFFVICLTFSITMNSFAQVSQKELLGKWNLIYVASDTVIIMDRYHPEKMEDAYMQRLRAKRPNYTKEDSLEVVKLVAATIKEKSEETLEFKKDNTFCFARPSQSGAGVQENCGKYILNAKKGTIQLKEEKVHTAENPKISLKDGILELETQYRGDTVPVLVRYEKAR